MSRPLKTKDELKEETRRVLEEEQEEFKKAAEKSAAKEEKEKELDELDTEELLKEERYFSPRDRARQKISDSTARKAGAEEDVFEKIEKDYYESRKKESEKERKFEEEFGRNLKKLYGESSDYITEKQAEGKIAVPEKGYGSRKEWYEENGKDFEARYNAAEDYVMSEGKNAFENAAKGMFNNLRSAIGTGTYDLAYAINDFAPWYKPAKDVLEKNTAGIISEKAQEQFKNAKEKGAGENLVNGLDRLSKNAGYNIFGAKAGNYIEALSEGSGEYKKLREQGYSKEEAAAISLGKISSEFLFSKADDYLLKNNKIDDVLFGKNGIVDKADDILSEGQKKSTIAERIERGEISTKIHEGRQRKHIEGSKEYLDVYKDGSNPQDILTVSIEEAQVLIDKNKGKGIPGKSDNSGTWTEFVDADHVIGKFYSKGKYYETKRFVIHYSKKGAHVIPVRPREMMKK